jgi:hypothetical protein
MRGSNLAIADEKPICQITPWSARYLMASVDFEGNRSDEAASDCEVTETQLRLERIVADTKELERE